MLCEGPRKARCRSLQFLESLRHAVLRTATISEPRPGRSRNYNVKFCLPLVCQFRLTFMIPSFCCEKPRLVKLKTVLSNFLYFVYVACDILCAPMCNTRSTHTISQNVSENDAKNIHLSKALSENVANSVGNMCVNRFRILDLAIK